MSEKNKNKKFILTGIIGTSLLFWLAQLIFGGIIHATAAFFTKEKWEKWKNRNNKN